MKTLHYRPEIDGLRAIAIVLVVFFHYFPAAFAGGFIGVDVFFVISGYLITGIILADLDQDRFSLKHFYFRRVRRLFPSLMIVLLFCLIVAQSTMVPAENFKLSKNMVGGLFFVANFTLWSDAGYFNIFADANPLLHLWSLGVEEQFYLFWPICLLVLFRKARALIMPSVILLLTLSFLSNILLVQSKPDLTFYFPFTRFWEIFMGVFLAVRAHAAQDGSVNTAWTDAEVFAGLLLILAGVILIDSHTWYPGWWGLLPAFGSALIIHAGPDCTMNRRLLSNRVLVWIGLISYPLYLWHWPLYVFFDRYLASWPFALGSITLIALSVLLAWMSYEFVERPVKQERLTHVVRTSLAAATVMTMITSLILFNQGWTINSAGDRDLPDALRVLVTPGFGGDIDQGWRAGECFLERGQGPELFTGSCMEAGDDRDVILWGDSHAAALYPGLRLLADREGFGLGQYTASACPPVLGWNGAINPLCEEINTQVMEQVTESIPGTVILHAAWYWSEYDWQEVQSTIEALQNAGIPRIILLGAAPTWLDTVPGVITEYYENYEEVPGQKTSFLLDTRAISNLDYRLAELADDTGIGFVSLQDIFCDEKGCMLYLDNILDVTSLDSGHLSGPAARYAANQMADTILLR